MRSHVRLWFSCFEKEAPNGVIFLNRKNFKNSSASDSQRTADNRKFSDSLRTAKSPIFGNLIEFHFYPKSSWNEPVSRKNFDIPHWDADEPRSNPGFSRCAKLPTPSRRLVVAIRARPVCICVYRVSKNSLIANISISLRRPMKISLIFSYVSKV